MTKKLKLLKTVMDNAMLDRALPEYLRTVELLRGSAIQEDYAMLHTLWHHGPFNEKDTDLNAYAEYRVHNLVVANIIVRGRLGVAATMQLRPVLDMMELAFPEPDEPDVLATHEGQVATVKWPWQIK